MALTSTFINLKESNNIEVQLLDTNTIVATLTTKNSDDHSPAYCDIFIEGDEKRLRDFCSQLGKIIDQKYPRR